MVLIWFLWMSSMALHSFEIFWARPNRTATNRQIVNCKLCPALMQQSQGQKLWRANRNENPSSNVHQLSFWRVRLAACNLLKQVSTTKLCGHFEFGDGLDWFGMFWVWWQWASCQHHLLSRSTSVSPAWSPTPTRICIVDSRRAFAPFRIQQSQVNTCRGAAMPHVPTRQTVPDNAHDISWWNFRSNSAQNTFSIMLDC